MPIDETTRTTLEQTTHRSHAGQLSFGESVAALIPLGVESYLADYRRGATTFYFADAATHAVALATPAVAIPDAFDAAAVRDAIGGAQRGEVHYPEFVRRTMQAGCVGYHVWISGRHVVYHGRRGETHVERFPGATTPVRAPVAVVQQVYAAFARRDLAAALAMFAPDIALEQSREVPWGGHHVGHDGARRFFATLMQHLDSTLALESFIDAGEQVVALGRTRGVTRVGAVGYDVPIAHVWTVQADRVTRVQFCIDNPTMLVALAAAAR